MQQDNWLAYRVRFTAARLAVGKNGAVVAAQSVVYGINAYRLENVLLRCIVAVALVVRPKTVIKSEVPFLDTAAASQEAPTQ